MRTTLVLPFLAAMLASCASVGANPGAQEVSVCGAIREPLVFWFWSRAAGEANPQRAHQISNAQALTYKTQDGRLLQGYKLKHTVEDGVARGSVLLAQGNAMLADQLLPAISRLSAAGLDVYLFDYRGYGQSGGRRRLKAIVSDYTEMFDNLLPQDNGKRFLYGISFGGIVVSNVIGSGVRFDRAVIDSSPSRLSNHGCEERYDPVLNIPQDASKLLVIAGEKDRVVQPGDSLDLRNAITQNGGKAVLHPEFAHPFMDPPDLHRTRMAVIRRYLLDEGAD